MMTSFFRYPGGKSKLLKDISRHLKVYANDLDLEYREPFFGGGSVGLRFIADHPNWSKIWINDKDVGVACLWTSLICFPEDLKAMVQSFKPSVEAFDDFKDFLVDLKKEPRQRSKVVGVGFKKLAIHQTSYSGLGTKSGGPLGGREQKSKYPIDCRWSPSYICKKIDKLHKMFSFLDIRDDACTNFDFEYLIKETGDSFLYVDPPYYVKGNDLYQCGFTEGDHERLAELLRTTPYWVLSYDDCQRVRELYDWAHVIELDEVNYSITATKDKESGKRMSRSKKELLICSKEHMEVFDDTSDTLCLPR
jgi:DNA adenine methylase